MDRLSNQEAGHSASGLDSHYFDVYKRLFYSLVGGIRDKRISDKAVCSSYNKNVFDVR